MVDLIIKNDGPSPIFTALLTELSVVFQERDDFRDEVERLTSEQGELAGLRNEVGSYAERVLDQDEEIRTLKNLADSRYEEIGRLQQQYAETSELVFDRTAAVNRLAAEVADQNLRLQDSARDLQRVSDLYADTKAKLDTAHRIFGDSFVHGETGPSRKNRAKLTPAQVGGIRSMVRNGSQRAYVARVYGVHPTTVSRIANGTYHREGTE
jgi:chromosome segregation ATPase